MKAQQSLKGMIVTILGVVGMILIFALPTSAAEPTPQEQAQAVAVLTNSERIEAGVLPVELDESLCAAAQQRAKEIAVVHSHTRPDGRMCSTVLDDNKIVYEVWGENIAGGQTTAEAVHYAWMNSPSHRENILYANYSKIGVGYYIDTADGVTYWCTLYI